MANFNYATALKKLHALNNKVQQAEEKRDALKEAIKAHMEEDRLKKVEGGGYTATLSTYTTTRLDTATFKKNHEDLYKAYSKASSTTRFTLK